MVYGCLVMQLKIDTQFRQVKRQEEDLVSLRQERELQLVRALHSDKQTVVLLPSTRTQRRFYRWYGASGSRTVSALPCLGQFTSIRARREQEWLPREERLCIDALRQLRNNMSQPLIHFRLVLQTDSHLPSGSSCSHESTLYSPFHHTQTWSHKYTA